jgi:putative endonuclease
MNNQEKGGLGEQASVDFLKQKGYDILERNYRSSYAEVDIIAQFQNQLIFVEVKTRSYTFYGEPEEFVTRKKQQNMAFVASMYMDEKDYDGEIRFDIIGIILKGNSITKINHIEDAFFPGL